ncbi:MAG TPA: DUF4175 family protein, partial [Tepidisphaeraceae bacterium]|nr:DUF4175 family protein [Tepidisphaeraceae bacterium]
MNDRRLLYELNNVGLRYRKLLLRAALAVLWASLAVAGLAALLRARGAGYAVPGMLLLVLVALPFLLVPVLLRWLRSAKDPLWVARRIERRFPDLDARLLAALEQKSEEPGRPMGYLQETVIGEALEHARRHDWLSLVPRRSLAVARVAQFVALLAFAAVVTTIVIDTRNNPGAAGWLRGGVAQRDEAFVIRVEPEDTEVERGTGLVVIARFGRELPGDVQLLYRETSAEGGEGQVRRVPMSKSLDDPVFASRLASVDRDMTYAVLYGDRQTRWFKVGVFDFPDLQRADAKLKYPEYTGLPEKVVEDTRSVTAVEGTKATLTFRLNKPVKDARLVERQKSAAPGAAAAVQTALGAPVELSVDPKDPTVYSVALDLKQSRTFKLHLTDEKGRANKEPTELAVNVTANRPPELKLEFPGRDVDVSPLEELSVRAQVWDDFGVKRVGMSYGIAGKAPKEVLLAEGVKGTEKRQVAQLLPLEKLDAEPDELLSYHLWVEDL